MASSSTEAPSAETRQSRFEQSVALSLALWPALTLAVQNNWGGPDSADKRDWFAGQVAEAFPAFTASNITSTTTTAPAADDSEPDAEYIEELLLQVMVDEFEVAVDDESSYDVAMEIIRLRGQCRSGNFEEVDRLLERWMARKGQKVVMKKGEDEEQDTDWDDTDGSDEEDEEMGEAPALVEKKEKAVPEVDEDGFTKVTRKR
ncbi:rRNA accumulation- protein [Gnomoniopsis smithogilvyi]|uniref:rRNA accumulation- protein n=1 Tax=Gnomoniopsis smithogilvyi TaxID=1191159 RepID=A0A9W9CYZ2_9PEZI|nr:rRNA accumulation- protein [Gnomoniopsis smithogilvyi]